MRSHWAVLCASLGGVLCTLPAACHRSPTPTAACIEAYDANDVGGMQSCEAAWLQTHDDMTMVRGAHLAHVGKDDVALKAWFERAPANLDGAKVMHYWATRLAKDGKFDEAEAILRRVLDLRRDRDPLHALNTAIELLTLVESTKPADQSIELALLGWRQAKLANDPTARIFAAGALVEVLLEIGEIRTATAVFDQMSTEDSRVLKTVAQASLMAATRHFDPAATLFDRAAQDSPHDPASGSPVAALLPRAQVQLDAHDLTGARGTLARITPLVKRGTLGSIEADSRLAVIEAEIKLADGDLDAAQATVERSLATPSRDRARVQLLGIEADIKARRGDSIGAVESWRRAADSVEDWRASVPSNELRTGLIARHRRVLESWLEWHAQRGEASEAAGVAQRILGRALLDRIHQREHEAPPTAEAAVEDVVERIVTRREVAHSITRGKQLFESNRDFIAFVVGTGSVWAIQHRLDALSVRRVGDRDQILAWVDACRAKPDDPAALKLGEAMFPRDSLPANDAALAVLLDGPLSDLQLVSLRVGDRYLVEYAPIVEVLAPDLLAGEVGDRAWSEPVVIGDATGDLDSAEDEAKLVADTLHVTAKTRDHATITEVEAATRARVLHIATHSRIAKGRASLALADGDLSANEIVRRRLAPRLAVIATCSSYVTDDPETSLVAAFLAAGTSGVIGAKRSLDDRATKRVVAEFYAAHGADDPVRALATAQRQEIHDHRPVGAWSGISFFGVGGWLGP